MSFVLTIIHSRGSRPYEESHRRQEQTSDPSDEGGRRVGPSRSHDVRLEESSL
jgi:hypothetical protein